eukprot:gene21333-25638_t
MPDKGTLTAALQQALHSREEQHQSSLPDFGRLGSRTIFADDEASGATQYDEVLRKEIQNIPDSLVKLEHMCMLSDACLRRFLDLQGVDAIARLFFDHPIGSDEWETAAYYLGVFCCYEDAQVYASNLRVFDKLVAMVQYTESRKAADSQAVAAKAISRLVTQSEDIKWYFTEHAIDPLVTLLDSPDVQVLEEAARAVAELAEGNGYAQQKIYTAGGLQILIKKSMSGTLAIRRCAWKAIGRLVVSNAQSQSVMCNHLEVVAIDGQERNANALTLACLNLDHESQAVASSSAQALLHSVMDNPVNLKHLLVDQIPLQISQKSLALIRTSLITAVARGLLSSMRLSLGAGTGSSAECVDKTAVTDGTLTYYGVGMYGKWTKESSGGANPSSFRYHYNPQYHVHLDSAAAFSAVLSKGMDHHGQKARIELSVYRVSESQQALNVKTRETVMMSDTGAYEMLFQDAAAKGKPAVHQTHVSVVLEPGHYVVVPSHDRLGRELDYAIAFASEAEFELNRPDFLAGWAAQAFYGGFTESHVKDEPDDEGPAQTSVLRNPQYLLEPLPMEEASLESSAELASTDVIVTLHRLPMRAESGKIVDVEEATVKLVAYEHTHIPGPEYSGLMRNLVGAAPKPACVVARPVQEVKRFPGDGYANWQWSRGKRRAMLHLRLCEPLALVATLSHAMAAIGNQRAHFCLSVVSSRPIRVRAVRDELEWGYIYEHRGHISSNLYRLAFTTKTQRIRKIASAAHLSQPRSVMIRLLPDEALAKQVVCLELYEGPPDEVNAAAPLCTSGRAYCELASLTAVLPPGKTYTMQLRFEDVGAVQGGAGFRALLLADLEACCETDPAALCPLPNPSTYHDPDLRESCLDLMDNDETQPEMDTAVYTVKLARQHQLEKHLRQQLQQTKQQ